MNGEGHECESGSTVEDLVRRHGLSPEATLVERNGTALRRRDWTDRELRENDRIEVLQVAAGG
ncbi:MAG: sulfur carrier protein ThiS [Chthoniobacterales bacterium]